jgi:hypothetical protein
MTDFQDTAHRPDDRSGRVRASDADRDRAVARLRAHHEQGRLDAGEFEERMSAALGAKYCDELPPLLADLPPERGDSDDEALPPWARRHHRAGPASGPRWHWLHGVPLLPVLALVIIVGSIGAVLHGHFPVLLLVGTLLVWKLRGNAGPWRTRPHAADHN